MIIPKAPFWTSDYLKKIKNQKSNESLGLNYLTTKMPRTPQKFVFLGGLVLEIAAHIFWNPKQANLRAKFLDFKGTVQKNY